MTSPTDEELIERAREWNMAISDPLEIITALADRLEGREGGEVVAWRYRTKPHRQWHLTERRTDAEAEAEDGSEVQPLYRSKTND